jgi:hypothetical protein
MENNMTVKLDRQMVLFMLKRLAAANGLIFFLHRMSPKWALKIK